MKLRYILLLFIVLSVYAWVNWRQPEQQSEATAPIVEMVPQPEAPEAVPEADMETLSPEDAEKDQ